MPYLLLYLLKLSFSLAAMFVFYQLLLRPLTFYQWNRFYLACYSLFSFIIPFVDIGSWMNENNASSSRLLGSIPMLENFSLFLPVGSGSWKDVIVREKWQLMLIVFAAGSSFMFFKVLYQYLSLQFIKRKAVLVKSSSVNLYDVNSNISPFSFANSIFINSRLHTAEDLQRIMQHEFVHVKQKHTADILIGELLVIINWFNPFAWLIRKAIRQNLEFIADNNVLKTGLDARQYQYLLLKVIGIPQYSITNNFNFSSLKKRIAMMNKIQSAKVNLLKFLFVVPLLGVLLVAFRQKHEITVKGSAISKIDTGIVNRAGDDTVPKPPPPPPALKGNHGTHAMIQPPPPPPPPPVPRELPENVKSITVNSRAVVILKDGDKETYDLSKPEEKAAFEKKYGKLVPPPPPPVPPVDPVPEVVSVTDVMPVSTVLQGVHVTSNMNVKPASKVLPVTATMPVSTVINDVHVTSDMKVKAVTNVKVSQQQPLYIIDGEPLPAGTDISTIDPSTIDRINVLKGAQATDLYGNKGVNGVVIVNTKKNTGSEIQASEDTELKAPAVNMNGMKNYDGLVIINGKESTREALSKLDPANIRQVNVLKGESATRLYKEKGKNGVVIVTTK